MFGKLVYKANDNYIELFSSQLEEIDYYCQKHFKNEDVLRNTFFKEINGTIGEFKILINPQEINMKEFKYHKDMYDFNHLHELKVRFDCSKKEEYIKKIANMMNNSNNVLDGIYKRFEEDFTIEDKKKYLIANLTNNKFLKLNVLGFFLEDRFNDNDSYLFVRELEDYCNNICKEELNKKNNNI